MPREVDFINREQYMAELTRLLSFMSSWDRRAALEKYDALLKEAEDPEAMMEELGTPTRLAIDLARTYVPTAAPEVTEAEVTEAEEEEAPEQFALDLEPEKEQPAPEPAVVEKTRGGVLAVYLIPAIVIGLPVALVLACIGLAVFAAGAALIAFAVRTALPFIAALSLVSDLLLTVGAALVLCAVGLLLVWLGLWLAITLCRLWIGGVIALGRKLCVKKEVV